MSNTPSDAEIEALAKRFMRPVGDQWSAELAIPDDGSIEDFARAVLAKWGTPQPVAREPLTDEQSHALLERMATEADQWAEGLSYEPTREQLAGWCVAFIQREIQAAHGIKGGQHGTE